MNFLSTVGCISALIGVLQFTGQFVVGVDIAFFLDKQPARRHDHERI